MKRTVWLMFIGTGLLLVHVLWNDGREEAPLAAQETPKAKVAVKLPLSTVAQRERSRENLKKLIRAVEGFRARYGCYPRDHTDKDGKPLLSWRVALLPFIGEEKLLKQFKLTEPWDSDHNKALLKQRIPLYRTGLEPEDSNDTYYQLFAGEKALFDPTQRVDTIRDGTSNTIGIIEAGPPVPWTKPADIAYDPNKPLPKLVGPYADLFCVGMLDGTVKLLKPEIDEKFFRQLIEYADGAIMSDKKRKAALAQPTLNTDEDKKAYQALEREALSAFDEYHKTVNDLLNVEKERLRLEFKKGDNIEEMLQEAKKLMADLERTKRNLAELREELETLKKK